MRLPIVVGCLMLLIGTAAVGLAQPVKIMPLGDSITWDNHSGDTRPDSSRTGYRYPLWNLLARAGYDVDFVGSLAGGSAYPFDPDNEGHGGWTDAQIASNVYSFLTSNPADIVLLHIGTNGLAASPDDVEDILDEIDRWESDNMTTVWVVLARIIDRVPNNSTTTAFNDNVEAMALARTTDNIVLCDMENGAGLIYAIQPAGDFWDSLHPNDDGYAKMAYVWFQALQTLLPPSTVTCPSGMTSYWGFESWLSPFLDYYGTNQAPYRNTHPLHATGQVGYAQSFSRTSQTRVEVPDDDSFDWGPDDSFSIEYWLKKSVPVGGATTDDNEVIVGRDDDSSGLHWWTGVIANYSSSGVGCFQLRDIGGAGGAAYSTTVLQDGQWHHFVAVRDAAVDSNRIYIDGVQEGSFFFDYTQGFAAVDVPIDVGWLNLTFGYHYTGELDEFALYDVALDPGDIAMHYIAGLNNMGYCQGADMAPTITTVPVTEARVSELYTYDVDAVGIPTPTYALLTSPGGMTIDPDTGLIQWTPAALGYFDVTVAASNTEGTDTQGFTIYITEAPVCPSGMLAYWQLNETSGTTYGDLYDGHDGAGGPHAPVPAPDGIVGGCQDFDGSSQYITVADHADFDWTSESSFSVEVWAKFTNVASRNKVMIGRDEDGGHPHWWLGAKQSTGTVVWNQLDIDAQGIACNGTTAINDGSWHHIVAVRKAAVDSNLLYVDGLLEDQKYYDYLNGFAASTTLGIGYMAYNHNPDYFYDGKLDEIALYNRVLTYAEIQDHYTGGLSGQGYCQEGSAPPQITSVPATEAFLDAPYTYDVDALGVPAPTYSLTQSPAGMSIDANSGIIEWTPATLDPADVTVEASNTWGTDTQSFTITVIDLPDCPSGTLAYWSLDETSGSSYADTYDGHDAGAPASAPAPDPGGVVNGCQDFDGTADYLTVPDHADFDWSYDSSFSIEVWARFTNVGGQNKVFIGRDEDGGYPHWWLGANSSTGYANFNLLDSNHHGIACTGSVALNDDQWHHLVAVRDESLDQNRLYVDGGLAASQPYDYTAGFEAGTQLDIAYMAYNHVPAYFYDGKLDEVAIYGRVLTDIEISQHYTNGLAGIGYCQLTAPQIVSTPVTTATEGVLYSYDVEASGNPAPSYSLTARPAGMTIDPDNGLIQWTPPASGDYDVAVMASNSEGDDTQEFTIDVGATPSCPIGMTNYWPFDEQSGGGPYTDVIGDADGSCTNCPTPTSGIVNGAQYFDGVGDEVNAADDDSYDWASDQSFTIAYWLHTTYSTAGNRVCVGRDDSGTSLHWWTGPNDAGNATFQLRDTNGNGISINGGPVLNDGEWHYYTAVRDESLDENRLYVDGEPVAANTHNYTAGFGSTVPLNIGFLNLSGRYRYQGDLDEISLYDRAVPAPEIKQNYLNGQAGHGVCDIFTPLIVSEADTTATAGEAYQYDVDAIGNPAPSYQLLTSPGGMTIDPNTGVIDWVPMATGFFAVSVEASSSQGEGDQSFIIHVSRPTGVPDEVPARFFLAANHPNPFNPATTIRFGLPVAGIVELAIFNIQGQRIKTLVNEPLPQGQHATTWYGRDDHGNIMASGIYFYRIKSGSFIQTRKMTLLK